jgi:hypothetical protein
MKDKFEILITKIIDDGKEPFPEKEIAWKGIEQKLQKNKTRKLIVRISIAASILLMFGSGTFIFNHMYRPTVVSDYYAKMSEELLEVEFYYTSLIDLKQKQIENSGPYDTEFFKPFLDELEILDEQYKNYKTAFVDFGCREELIRALIENQQQKLEILNRLLSEIQKVKNYENRKKVYRL